ncbi:hypothetical protein [Mangrovimonas spongiae]|uniref:Carboxypeptidase regulatory-like domain-containing protein n=1 Tax=Mangrovimonas spongiae TaxID=2494697 RepID=A0A428JX07_9FLAO|nr:hypothetical protein [Mangrovimonas spongiae]RSK38739.1 hypothetical protein EJA19_11830 [Mangrovimonas spongiae]
MGRLIMYKKYMFILYLSFHLNIQSQISLEQFNYLKSNIPSETVDLKINSQLLLAGEYLNYYAYCKKATNNEALSDISKIMYVTLIGKDNNSIFQHKLKIKKGAAYGDFFIPATIKTGHYKLIGYTNWSKNNLEKPYSIQDIFIINTFSNNSQFTSDKGNSNQNIVIYKDSILFKNYKFTNNNSILDLKNDLLKTRSKGMFKITYPEKGFYTISIKKIDSIKINDKTLETDSNKLTFKKTNYFLPELRGEIISGQVISQDNSKVDNISLALSFPGNSFIFKIAKTNSKGEFLFLLNKNQPSSKAIIQIQDKNKENYNININEKFISNFENLTFHPLKLDRSLQNLLKQKSIYNQIENAYYNVKKDSLINYNNHDEFYKNIAKRYVLDDYTRFPTLKETFIEIIQSASLIKEKNEYFFKVRDLNDVNNNTDILNLKPLVMVDGILIQDINSIIDFKTSKIKYIDIVNGLYLKESQIYDGIVSIKTFSNNYTIKNDMGLVKNINIYKPQQNKVYYQPNYSLNNKKNIPDFRSQLLWIPVNQKEKGESNEIQFFTSDVKGIFEIKLEGYTKNGEVISKCFFEVN